MLIHGKEYTPVSDRLNLVHGSGKSFEIIESQPLQMGERWAWRCTILLDGKRYCGSAEVHFNAKPGSADATDPMACAETSAIGRALGFAGVLSLDGIASADELTRNETPTMPPQRPTARPANGTSSTATQPTHAMPAPSGDDLQAQMDALKADFEALYPDKPDIWPYVLTKAFDTVPTTWTSVHVVRLRGYYLQCRQKVESRRRAQEDAA